MMYINNTYKPATKEIRSRQSKNKFETPNKLKPISKGLIKKSARFNKYTILHIISSDLAKSQEFLKRTLNTVTVIWGRLSKEIWVDLM